MAWIEPKTDWSNDDRCTYEDLNRIGQNIKELMPSASVRTNYTQADILTKAEWNTIINSLRTLTMALGVNAVLPSFAMTASNFNAAESLIQKFKERLDFIFMQKSANIYLGDDLYSAADGSYTEVAENYIRGV